MKCKVVYTLTPYVMRV